MQLRGLTGIPLLYTIVKLISTGTAKWDHFRGKLFLNKKPNDWDNTSLFGWI
jgi:hypothetical protein